MERDVLNKGKVELLDYMGSDHAVLRAARVSTGADATKGPEKDRALIRYLYRNEHISPFAFISFHFYFKMPIFVQRQFIRHRTFDVNEASARYKKFLWEVWSPDEWRTQDTANKQGSDGIASNQELSHSLTNASYTVSNQVYESLMLNNVSREQARAVMPVAQYTEFHAHINLRNLFHFLELRLDEHAQPEIREYAEAILSILEEMESIKYSIEIFKDMYSLKQLFRKCVNMSHKKFASMDPIETYLRDFIRSNA